MSEIQVTVVTADDKAERTVTTGTRAWEYRPASGAPMTASALAYDTNLPVRNYLTMVGPIDFGHGEFSELTAGDQFDARVDPFHGVPGAGGPQHGPPRTTAQPPPPRLGGPTSFWGRHDVWRLPTPARLA